MALCIETQMVTDTTLEMEGVWYDYDSGTKVKLARYNNEAAQKARIEGYQEWKTLLESKTPEADAKAEELEVRVMAEHVLKDLEGFVDPQGKPVKYTLDVGIKYLTLSKDFRQDMQRLSSPRTKYLNAVEESAELAKK